MARPHTYQAPFLNNKCFLALIEVGNRRAVNRSMTRSWQKCKASLPPFLYLTARTFCFACWSVVRVEIAGLRLFDRLLLQLFAITLVLVERAPSSLSHCTAISSGNIPRISGMNRSSLLSAALMQIGYMNTHLINELAKTCYICE